jgi:hypothetical protein
VAAEEEHRGGKPPWAIRLKAPEFFRFIFVMMLDHFPGELQ